MDTVVTSRNKDALQYGMHYNPTDLKVDPCDLRTKSTWGVKIGPTSDV